MALPEGLSRADGMTGVIIFAVVYAIVSILAKAKEAARKQSGGDAEAEAQQQARERLEERKRQLQQRQQQRQQQLPPRSSRPVSPAPGNTQAEGARLQDLLRVLTEAAGVPTPEGPLGRRPSAPLPSDEDVEERESLEVEERIQNLESTERRPERREVDFDDEAEAIVQRRIKAAQDRDRSLSRLDHAAFDQKIRAVPDATRVTRPKLDSLRQAIVWREILGPPVALRKPSDPEF
jgi:hypothetical protein